MNAPMLHRGKLAKVPKVLSVRPLVREDLGVLNEERPMPRPQKLRETHRRLAMMVARGFEVSEIVAITGYSTTRIIQLKAAPAFQELVAQFRPEADRQELDIIDEYRALRYENAMKAERMIGEHLDRAEDEDELIPIKSLLPISHDFADRFGYGKKSLHGHVNVDFAAEMEAMQARSGRSSVIDAKVVSPSPALAPSPPVAASPSPPVGNQSRGVPSQTDMGPSSPAHTRDSHMPWSPPSGGITEDLGLAHKSAPTRRRV